MAGLAIPALEAAFLALLAALGLKAASETSEALKQRQRAVSEAGTGAAAQTATQTRTKTCEKCPPECGALKNVNHHMSPASREYQARVTGFAPGTEWDYRGIDFDGFSSADCHLKEAKGNYDQFLERDSRGQLAPVFFFNAFKTDWPRQARQQAAITISSPPARMTWFLQGPLAYEFMAPTLSRIPPIAVMLFL